MWYVTWTDTFCTAVLACMNLTDKVVVECNTLREAEKLQERIESRSDSKRVNICSNKPHYPSSRYKVTYGVYSEDANYLWAHKD